MKLVLAALLVLALVVVPIRAADLGSPVPMPKAKAGIGLCDCKDLGECICQNAECRCEWCKTPVAARDDPRVRVWTEPEPVRFLPPPAATYFAAPSYFAAPQIPQAFVQAQNCRS